MSQLPKILKATVDFLGTELGVAIQNSLGKDFYNKVEDVRKSCKSASSSTAYAKIIGSLEKLSFEERFQMAHSFSVLLELMNCAEAAYRSIQLRAREDLVKPSKNSSIEIVLTAHPTESRSKQLVRNSEAMTGLLVRYFQDPSPGIKERIQSLVEKFWLESISKAEKPNVMDEADYIYEITLNSKILRFLISKDGPADVKLITWVGGDKDGHPLIDEKAMLGSLSRSRKKIVTAITGSLDRILVHLKSVHVINPKGRPALSEIAHDLGRLQKQSAKLTKVKAGDWKSVNTFSVDLKKTLNKYLKISPASYQARFLIGLLDKFPALVMPLEIREHAGIVEEALKNKDLAIYKMLNQVDKIAEVSSAHFYIKGLILSHTETAHNLNSGFRLMQTFKSLKKLPVVPLLESSAALESGPKIISEYLSDLEHEQFHKQIMSSRFEVMVGYSDSSKEFGALPSRKKIRDAIRKIESTLSSLGLQPVFFHGSGGSVARGGGSVAEQIAWWPKSCRKLPKMTIQGEMVQRTFSRTEVLSSFISRFQQEKMKTIKIDATTDKTFNKFIDGVEATYREFVADRNLLGSALGATPYHYLDQLKLGSRPAKRKSNSIQVSSLRAIPWVLCWTQTRNLFPAWWGIGTSWGALTSEEKKSLIKFAKVSPLLSSYLKLLGFTLAKMDLSIWNLYLESFLKPKDADKIKSLFALEHKRTKIALFELANTKDLLWYKPWLEESISMRSKYITPLNLLQIISMKEQDSRLLRECVTGIACGMMTTG